MRTNYFHFGLKPLTNYSIKLRCLKIIMQALALFLCILCVYAASSGNAAPKVLVLGGNDMVSSQTVVDLKNYWTSVVNEGNWSGWDKGRINAIATVVTCSDMNKLGDCYGLKRQLKYEQYFHAYIDFKTSSTNSLKVK